MIRSVKDLHRCSVAARDGSIGKVNDLYFDDQRWVIRYLVVEATQLDRVRPVLISPMSVGSVNWSTHLITLSVTQEQVRNSPDIDTTKPVSRQREAAYLHYYQYPYYWGGTGPWGAGLTPAVIGPIGPAIAGERGEPDETDEQESGTGDSHLRSTYEVIGYYIKATDGDLGHIDDFLVDDESWAIRYAVVDTSNWWFGRKVVLDPERITDVNWSGRKVLVGISRQSLKNATPFDSEIHLEHERDPQGWGVVGNDGRLIGRVVGVIADPSTLQIRYLDVDLESDGERVLLAAEDAELKPADRVVTFAPGRRHG
jgi:sporulation protein YlmC with PRC-barrel domain